MARHTRRPSEQCRAAADLSPKMVEFAALRVEAAGLGSRIATQQADAQDLDAWQVRPAAHPAKRLSFWERTPVERVLCRRSSCAEA